MLMECDFQDSYVLIDDRIGGTSEHEENLRVEFSKAQSDLVY